MILVTGATGTIGRHLVAELVARGARVRALVRDPAAQLPHGAERVVADLDDPATLPAAFAGARALFLNTNVDDGVVERQARAIAHAREAGVMHVVKVSVQHAAPGALLAGAPHAAIEALLAASGVAHTVLRPAGFMQNFLADLELQTVGTFRGAYGEGRVPYVDARDLATAAARLLAGDIAPTGRAHVVTGPQALTHRELAALLTEATGRPITYVDRTPGALAAELTAAGLPAAFASDLAELMQQTGQSPWSAPTTGLEALLGRPPRTFAAFAADHAAVLAGADRVPSGD